MPRFIARPVTVEAYCWEGNGAMLPDDFRLAMSVMPDGTARVSGVNGTSKTAQRGDWLVRGSDGLIVAMKAAAFEVAFEEITAEPVDRVKRPYNRKEHAHV